MLGLSWGSSPDDAKGRFQGLEPEDQGLTVRWRLDALVDRLALEGTSVPDAIGATDRSGDLLTARFVDQKLVSLDACFGYRFESIGQNPDALSDQAMAAIARSEWGLFAQQLSTRYGAPAALSDGPARAGAHQITAWALFVTETTVLRAVFGHDVRGLAGHLSYLPTHDDSRGF